jgi:hypothetical protein
MSNLPAFSRILEKTRGYIAQIRGNLYNVYRLNGSSAGNLVDPANLVISNFKMAPERTSASKDVEATWMIKVPLFWGDCDPSTIQVGDLFVEEGFHADASAFTFAGYRPAHLIFFVQTPVVVTFARTDNNTAHVDGGRVPYEGYMPGIAGADVPLVLAAGEYSWTPSGTASPVYVGLVPQERVGHYPSPDVKAPDDIQLENWHLYAPPAVAAQLLENDYAIVTTANGPVRYRLRSVFSQALGIQGGMFLAEKAWP